MPHVAANPIPGGGTENVYAYLRTAEENLHASRGGLRRIVSTGDKGASTVRETKSPSPTLTALRADRPVTVPGWKLPREFRRGDIRPGDTVIVYPDGSVEKQ